MIKKYKTYEEASAATIALFKEIGIDEPTQSLYQEYCKEDLNLPYNPDRHYSNFSSWSEYLGKEKPVEKYKTYEEASTAAITLFNELDINTPTRVLYLKHYRKNPKLPADPNSSYHSFTSWTEFLGNKKTAQKYKTYEEASTAVISLFNELDIEVPTQPLYTTHYKKDPMLPYSPDKQYKEFISWPKFLGKEKLASKYKTCKTASTAAAALFKKLNIDKATVAIYSKHYKKDPKLPANPSKYYHEFTSWPEFFRSEKFINKYETYEEASAATITLFNELNINKPTKSLYRKHYKNDKKLFYEPDIYYSNFTSWPEFLGKEKPIEKYKTYEEASTATIALFNKLNIDKPSQPLYIKHYKADPKLLYNPDKYYNNFSTWPKFFGTERYKTYEEASAAAIALFNKLDINKLTKVLYKKHYKKDPRLPAEPNYYYSDFTSWPEFLGREKSAEKYKTYEEASTAAITLFNKLDIDEATQPLYAKHYKIDPKLPYNPDSSYSDFTSWPEFLGRKKPAEKYKTCEEASDAAIYLLKKLSIDTPTSTLFSKHYKEDPKLPSDPREYYNNFTSWPEFLGREKPAEKYKTYEEALAATIALFKKFDINKPTAKIYSQYYKNDPKLPANPNTCYNDFTSWNEFMGVANYYLQAKEALIRFKTLIGNSNPTKNAYISVRLLDSKLPIDPVKYYNLPHWPSFLNQRFYDTWQEASEIVCKIIPTEEQTRAGYNKHYKTDPLLHSTPDKHYPDFPGWDKFFGRKVFKKYNLEEARELCHEKESWSKKDYDRLSTHDKRLPLDPAKYYEFNSYREFLQIEYWDIQKVKKYCEENRIVKLTDYKKHASIQPRLKVQLTHLEGYQNSKDILWKPHTFQPLIDLNLRMWGELAEDYCSNLVRNVGSSQVRIQHYLMFCVPFIQKIDAIEKVAPFFERKNEVPSIEEYINTLSESQRNNGEKNIITGFLKDLFEKSFYLEDEYTGERTPVPNIGLYRIPYMNVDIESDRITKTGTNKPDLPYEYVVKARDHLIPDFIKDNGELIRCESFNQLSVAQKLNSADWYEVNESVIDKKDPNCVWRKLEKHKKIEGKRSSKITVYEMWSPVRSVALYCLLNLPTRGQQILWLDSGEADEFKLINNGFKSIDMDGKVELVPDFEWIKNDNPLVGLQKKSNQGVLHKSGDDIGMFTNTNKTGKPFVSPYIPTRLIPWIIRLRDWQSKYNRIKEPTRWSDVHFNKFSQPSTAILMKRGAQCFLFRNPVTNYRSADIANYQPVKQNIFANALAKVLYEIQDDDFPLAEKVESQYSSKYTPHTMRVSLITSLVLYGDVPLHILMKVVGHAQIIMTIHYTNVTYSDIVNQINAGEKKALAQSQDRKTALLMENEIHNYKDELLIPKGSALHDSDWPKASIQFFDYGMCPYGGTRCSDGGDEREETKNSKFRTEYNPVPAGYLGCQNCFRCRHFVTGYPFIAGLIAKGNEIAEAKQYISNNMHKINVNIEKMDEYIYELELSGKIVPTESKIKYKRLNNLLEQEQTRKDMLSCDFLSAYKLAHLSNELLNKPTSKNSKVPLVMNTSNISISVDEVSHHQALAEVCENADIFLSANADKALPRRSQNLDKILANNNIPPQLFKFSEEMQLRIGNQMTQIMIARLGGWGEVNKVLDGIRPLDTLGQSEDSNLIPLSEEIQTLLQSTIKIEE